MTLRVEGVDIKNIDAYCARTRVHAGHHLVYIKMTEWYVDVDGRV